MYFTLSRDPNLYQIRSTIILMACLLESTIILVNDVKSSSRPNHCYEGNKMDLNQLLLFKRP